MTAFCVSIQATAHVARVTDALQVCLNEKQDFDALLAAIPGMV